MRRFLSILLAIAVGLGPASGLASQLTGVAAGRSGWTGKEDESRLPACCRRGGKHHCAAMNAAMGRTGGASLTSGDRCPCMPRAMVSIAPASAHLAAASRSIPDPAARNHGAPGAIDTARFRAAHAWPKRGPPANPEVSAAA
jgi:hypothetical protein